jgi:hypothetical protein
MKYRWRASGLAFLAGLGLALGGCSQSPLAPDNPVLNGGTGGSLTSPPILALAADGSVSYVPAPVGTTAGVSVLAASALPRSVSSSAVIDGSKGGTVRASRFSVKLPAGAFVGSATVTVSMADSTVMICDLAISPQSANKFKYPAALTADLSGTGVYATAFTMYWYDPSNKVWVNLFAQSATTSTSVTAYLNHFSKYAAGKAGW